MDRNSRKLSHQKGNKVKLIDNPPLSSEGSDGDMMLQATGVGAILYVKGKGRWFKFRPSEGGIDGWHGNTSRIRITPSDFRGGVYASGDVIYQSINCYVSNNSTTNYAVINVPIPKAFKVTGFELLCGEAGGGSTTLPTITAFWNANVAAGTTVTLVSGAAFNSEISVPSQISTDNNYLSLFISGWRGNTSGGGVKWHIFTGGFVHIQPVLTPERIMAGMTDEDVLSRES
jgi:hypothetical protein